jgi:hypothetical protein
MKGVALSENDRLQEKEAQSDRNLIQADRNISPVIPRTILIGMVKPDCTYSFSFITYDICTFFMPFLCPHLLLGKFTGCFVFC